MRQIQIEGDLSANVLPPARHRPRHPQPCVEGWASRASLIPANTMWGSGVNGRESAFMGSLSSLTSELCGRPVVAGCVTAPSTRYVCVGSNLARSLWCRFDHRATSHAWSGHRRDGFTVQPLSRSHSTGAGRSPRHVATAKVPVSIGPSPHTSHAMSKAGDSGSQWRQCDRTTTDP